MLLLVFRGHYVYDLLVWINIHLHDIATRRVHEGLGCDVPPIVCVVRNLQPGYDSFVRVCPEPYFFDGRVAALLYCVDTVKLLRVVFWAFFARHFHNLHKLVNVLALRPSPSPPSAVGSNWG